MIVSINSSTNGLRNFRVLSTTPEVTSTETSLSGDNIIIDIFRRLSNKGTFIGFLARLIVANNRTQTYIGLSDTAEQSFIDAVHRVTEFRLQRIIAHTDFTNTINTLRNFDNMEKSLE